MEVNFEVEFEKWHIEINSNENIKDNFVIRKAEKLKIKVIIYNVSEFIAGDDLKQ